ncbi:hypothetical protein NPJ88_000185 [Halomonas elongata]|uniref:hypothetical protein n=1 Tax=Halomonas elongata TaxID=2746 RepID=UPI00255A7A40|nr:hypothetical protein [Halomonas elongata]MDL4860740.1 hypothetical protein [Halomonas elongata]
MRNISTPTSVALALLLASLPTTASAASCIAQQAAEAGADSAYERKKEEIQAIEEAEENAISEWGQCLGSISGQIGWPTFPSTGDIFEKIKREVCRIAQRTVDDQIDQVNDNIDDIYNQAPSVDVPVDVPVIGGTEVFDPGSAGVDRSHGDLSGFYEGLWQ